MNHQLINCSEISCQNDILTFYWLHWPCFIVHGQGEKRVSVVNTCIYKTEKHAVRILQWAKHSKNMPPHDKTNKMTNRPAKTQISLGPVWSESSLCAQWVAKNSSFLHADSEDSEQTGRMPRLIWVFAGRTCHFVGFVMRRLKSDLLHTEANFKGCLYLDWIHSN